MKQIFLYIILFGTLQVQSQVLFSRVYTVPEDGTGLLNIWPNYLKAVFPTDTLIYAFGYSADTTYKEIYGTAFFVFDLNGNLLEYYHIKDSERYNFFEPEGIHTWDGITFYTSFSNFSREVSILKFNRISKEQSILEIRNSKIQNGDILRGNMIATNDGCLVTASDIAFDSTGYNYKIQVTKIDTEGNIKWQIIIGQEPENKFSNHCFSTYTDLFGNIYVGIGFNDYSGVGWRGSYQSLFYKLDIDGNTKKIYTTQLAKEGYNQIYDIAQDSKNWFYLSSDYNWNEPKYPYGNRSYGALQVLDSNLVYQGSINLVFDSVWTIAPLKSFEKIIRSNDNNGFIIGGQLRQTDSIITYIDSLNRFDTIRVSHYVLNFFKLNDDKQIEWKRYYRIRNGYDHGWLHDLKSFPGGGYIIGAQSFEGLAYENFKEPYYMPWLLRVDDDGCLVPGCETVSNKELLDNRNNIFIYPNPANDYFVILHSGSEKTHYQIVSAEGKIIDNFYSFIEGEQIIVLVNNFKPGHYFVKAESKSEISSKVFIKQ